MTTFEITTASTPHHLDTITSFKELVWPIDYNKLIDKTANEVMV